ncbi:MAG: hypothetical protein BMS9Abin33_0974 [Gammaproteobacteria bacterium]|nr:MAG: hypothetical protein BMS9Abin33_0974 [Gammaproteobacteria bacterium]
MKNLPIIIGILIIVFAVSSLFKNKEYSSPELTHPKLSTGKQNAGGCMSIDEFIAENPDYSPEEFSKVIECNRERAARLGLDKPNTGFLGNTYSRPDGALAHYELAGGRKFFTVYNDYILISASSTGKTEIPFSEIEKIGKARQMPGTINIKYQNDSGDRMQFSISLFRKDDLLKAEGATDLDRLITLLKQLKNKSVK